jgi:putative ATPase
MQIQPLAARLRPETLQEYSGQEHLLDKNKPLLKNLLAGHCHSMLFWGPPGTGKTTLAHLIAKQSGAQIFTLSAVMAGVKDIRSIIAQIKQTRAKSIVFIDEIHRFNKSQQDALLPFVENGLFYLIGATTENPSFEVNNALLSRCRVYTLKKLSNDALEHILNRGLLLKSKDFKANISISSKAKDVLIQASDGDARKLLTCIDIVADLVSSNDNKTIDLEHIKQTLSGNVRQFDKGGDWFFDHISAMHKSVRSSCPDAALYWFCRMVDGGADIKYLGRRILRMASEDIGNADPRALTICNDAIQVFERLGSPEGELALAQALIYLAAAPKSNAVYTAFNKAMQVVKQGGSEEIPPHLRNAPTKLMKEQGNSKGYQYDHDTPDGIAYTQQCMPPNLIGQVFYEPAPRGLELKIAEKLNMIKNKRNNINEKSLA